MKGSAFGEDGQPIDLSSRSAFVAYTVRIDATDGVDATRLRALRGLQTLSWKSTQQIDSAAEPIGSLRSLKDLALDAPDLSDSVMDHLGRLRELELLHLGCSRSTTDVGWQHLSGLSHLYYLSLFRSAVDDAGLVHVGSLPDLVNLHLAQCPNITSAGVRHLTGLPVLRALDLSNTRIDDKVVGHLKQIDSLRIVDLQRTAITRAGVEELHEALPKCAIIWNGGFLGSCFCSAMTGSRKMRPGDA